MKKNIISSVTVLPLVSVSSALASLPKSHQPLHFNNTNAQSINLDMNKLKNLFLEHTGRKILDHETIQVRYEEEGGFWDFSTFDGVSVQVPFEQQYVSPNKGVDSETP